MRVMVTIQLRPAVSSQHLEEILQPILREEVEIAVDVLKKGKSAGVDNIPAEIVQAGGESMIDSSVRITEPLASSVIQVKSY